jgi:hypothetical protein
LLELQDALVASVRAARSDPETLAYEASARYGYPPGFLARYFEKLRYSFGPRERAGLLTFLELAHEVGELDRVPELPLRGGHGSRGLAVGRATLAAFVAAAAVAAAAAAGAMTAAGVADRCARLPFAAGTA